MIHEPIATSITHQLYRPFRAQYPLNPPTQEAHYPETSTCTTTKSKKAKRVDEGHTRSENKQEIDFKTSIDVTYLNGFENDVEQKEYCLSRRRHRRPLENKQELNNILGPRFRSPKTRVKVGKTQEGGVELCFQKRFSLTKNNNVLKIQSLIEFRV